MFYCNFFFFFNLVASKKLQSPAGNETLFLKRSENVWSSLLLQPALQGIKLSDEESILGGPQRGSGRFAGEERRKERITRRGIVRN